MTKRYLAGSALMLSLLAPPAFEQPNELTSPIIVSGGPITHLWGGRSGIIEW